MLTNIIKASKERKNHFDPNISLFPMLAFNENEIITSPDRDINLVWLT